MRKTTDPKFQSLPVAEYLNATSWIHSLAKTLAGARFIWWFAGSSINPVSASRYVAHVVRNSLRLSEKYSAGH
jgi:hypothetical protein